MVRFPWIIALLAVPTVAFAHSGGTDTRGGHFCKTDCERYGYEYGQYHFHTERMNAETLAQYESFRMRLCERVRKRFSSSPESFIRVSGRVRKRLGINCGGIPSTSSTILPGIRNRSSDTESVSETRDMKEQATVIRTIDGDTIEVRMEDGAKEKVRFIGIDAPELKDSANQPQCFALKASHYLRRTLGRGRVELVAVADKNRDIYGRLLRYVHFRNADIGRLLLAEGIVRVYPWFEHPRSDKYDEAEHGAKNVDKGLWTECS